MAKDVWTVEHVASLAPDEASIPAARKVLKKGGFGTVEPTGDGRGWWVVCQGLTDTYQVSARRADDDRFACECTCPSYKDPCKHALALLLHLVEHPELRTEADAPKASAGDYEGLVRAAFAHPDDDTPRLILADWLDENDQPDRAALIRHQCERARLKDREKRARELDKLITPLVAKLTKQIGEVPERVTFTFRRGFIRVENLGYYSDLGALPARFANLFREGWVESVLATPYQFGVHGRRGVPELIAHVGTLDVSTFGFDKDELTALVADTGAARATGRLAHVLVSGANKAAYANLLRAQAGGPAPPTKRLPHTRFVRATTPATLDLLVKTEQVSGARDLTVFGELSDAEVPVLLGADLSTVTKFGLTSWRLGAAGVTALFAGLAEQGARLDALDFDMCRFADGALAALAAAPGLSGLTQLSLTECDLTDARAAELATGGAFARLPRLDLGRNERLGARGATAVLDPARFPALTRLDLEECAVPVAGHLPLVLDAPARPDLEVHFGGVSGGPRVRRTIEDGAVRVTIRAGTDEHFAGLPGTAGARRVAAFTAPAAGIGAAEVPALVGGFDPGTLRRIDLTDNSLRNDGAGALAAALAGFALDELNLTKCRIQSAGAAALATGLAGARVKVLNLSGNHIGKAGAAALAGATFPGLTKLILTDCGLAAAERNALTAALGNRAKF